MKSARSAPMRSASARSIAWPAKIPASTSIAPSSGRSTEENQTERLNRIVTPSEGRKPGVEGHCLGLSSREAATRSQKGRGGARTPPLLPKRNAVIVSAFLTRGSWPRAFSCEKLLVLLSWLCARLAAMTSAVAALALVLRLHLLPLLFLVGSEDGFTLGHLVLMQRLHLFFFLIGGQR